MASKFRIDQLRALGSTVFHGIGDSLSIRASQNHYIRHFSDASSPPLSPAGSSLPPPQNVELQTAPQPEKMNINASTTSSVNQLELAKFSAISETW
ncbi:ubiquinone biosynthesis O-methyltransferase [Cucumis melo var. makuwa]|nr:ubiquinone biosynthesis O-methyltransferase [Cucumis melo var. makuwa]TYJ98267.1 ubiquinone biosynthesis O-methyltransferase [Cucumis melo var. makuwa]